MFHFVHHIHQIATILKHASPDCVGERVGIYQCCVCHKTFRNHPLWVCGVGQPKNRTAYEVAEEAIKKGT